LKGSPRWHIPLPLCKIKGKFSLGPWIVKKKFDRLKHLLTTAPILSIADPKKEYVIYIDNIKKGVGDVLIQEGKFIAYESRKLKEHEQKYPAYDLELMPVIHTLKMW